MKIFTNSYFHLVMIEGCKNNDGLAPYYVLIKAIFLFNYTHNIVLH